LWRLVELAVNVTVVEVPLLETDVHDVDGLTQLADLIVPDRRENRGTRQSSGKPPYISGHRR
jgi:hypothetical protein